MLKKDKKWERCPEAEPNIQYILTTTNIYDWPLVLVRPITPKVDTALKSSGTCLQIRSGKDYKVYLGNKPQYVWLKCFTKSAFSDYPTGNIWSRLNIEPVKTNG